MAGVTLQFDDREVRDTLNRLIRAGGDLTLALKDIGEYLDLAHRARWDKEQAPDGTRWTPLSDETLRRKMLRGVSRSKGRRSLTTRAGNTKAGAIRALGAAQILVESGGLRDLLRYQVEAGGTALQFGTDRVYGATHHYGREEDGIPARPWLGTSEADNRAILDILRGHLQRALGAL